MEEKLGGKFKILWKNYIVQSLLATITLLIVLLFISIERHAVIIASIGASAFIVFAMPRSITAKPRNLIGGHLVGLLCGSLLTLISSQSSDFRSFLSYSLAVGLSIFIMVATDTEHPPASGTALGIAIEGFSFGIAFTVVISAIILSIVHHLLRSFLKDLV